MPRCFDLRDLSELDPVTFFIVTELMAAERERHVAGENRSVSQAIEAPYSEVA